MIGVAPEPQPTRVDPLPQERPASLCLAPGTELLGEYEASAFTQPQYLLRRADGQVIQLTRLLYLVASALERNDRSDMAAQVSAGFGRPVSVDNIDYLIAHKLAPLGVVAPENSSDQRPASPSEPLVRSTPLLLGLRFRTRVVPERLHRGVSTALRPLFWAPLVIAVLVAFATFDAWLVTQAATIVRGAEDAIAHPDQLLVVIAISVGVGFFHEIGHATAARYGGVTPGVMGVGIYLMLPVFYTDVTDSYRLSRRGRLRTDLGGLYFNVLVILVAAAVYAATHYALLLVFVGLSQLEMVYQFLPFVRMDGYYVVSDLIGVPNLFAYVAPTISRLTRRNNAAGRARLGLLKPAARRAITAWVALTVPILVLNFALLALLAPRLFPAMWASAHTQARGLAAAAGRGDLVGAANHLTELVLVAVPAAGMVFLAVSLFRRLAPLAVGAARPVAQLLHRRPVRAVSVAALALMALIACLADQNVHHPTSPAATPTPAAGAVASPTETAAAASDTMMAVTPDGGGYWTVTPDGNVVTHGDARFYGSEAGTRLNQPVVAIAATPDGHGYWLAAADGGVFTHGDAAFYGSEAGTRLNQPVVAIAATPDGHGYWLAAADGGVFTFGDAAFDGSEAGTRLNQPVVAISPTPDGHGYWLAAGDGGVFTYGDAAFYGSEAGTRLNQPVVAISPTPDGHGYWLAAGDGGVFTFGDAAFEGSAVDTSHSAPVTGIIVTDSPGPPAGYQLVAADGTPVPLPRLGPDR